MSKYHKMSKKGHYDIAKQAELTHRNLSKALQYYALAIQKGDKKQSAIKDYAAVLHQTGRTEEAVEFLIKMKPLIKQDLKKYENLIRNLDKQKIPSGKFVNKSLLILNEHMLSLPDTRALFQNHSRILELDFYKDLSLAHSCDEVSPFILAKFVSYSSAKKTLQTVTKRDDLRIYWVNQNRLIVSEAYPYDANSNTFYYGDNTWTWSLIIPEPDDRPRGLKAEAVWGPREELTEDQVSTLRKENQEKLSWLSKNY